MRIVSWNCCSDGARKWGWVEQLGADVAVICEGPRRSPRPHPSLLEPAVAWHAAGSLEHKHVAIGSSRLDVDGLEARVGQGQWAVAARLAEGPEILGVWSRPPKPSGATYATSVVSTLTAWSDRLAAGGMLVAGDFNVGFPIGRDGWSLYASRVAHAWEAIGLVSVYHAYFEVEMGQESRATYFDKRRRALGWHIDYILVHRDHVHRIRNVEVGDFWEWVLTGRSDHVPLIVDIDW